MNRWTNGRMAGTIAAVLLAGGLAACGSDDDGDGDGTDDADPMTGETGGGGAAAFAPAGLVSVEGVSGVAEAVGAVQSALMMNDAANALPVVDHAANAASADLELPPTQLLLFGNPALGSRLMQENPVAGLDLPQKLLVWEDEGGVLRVAYNSSGYVAARHGIEGAAEALGSVDGALAGLAAVATGTTDGAGPNEGEGDASDDAPPATAGQGVETIVSEQGFEATYAALIGAIEAAGPLSIVAEVDHSAAAAGVGIELAPLRLVVFGNPAAGTPLMQSARTVGIDLPQKMLVHEDGDGRTMVSWNDPAWLAERHGITDRDEAIETISGALSGLASAAAGAP